MKAKIKAIKNMGIGLRTLITAAKSILGAHLVYDEIMPQWKPRTTNRRLTRPEPHQITRQGPFGTCFKNRSAGTP
jgi:hypothetical protein